MVKLELDWLLLTKPLEIELTAVRTTLAPAPGTHRHTAAAVAKASKACLRSGVFNLAADMGKNVLTAVPEVVAGHIARHNLTVSSYHARRVIRITRRRHNRLGCLVFTRNKNHAQHCSNYPNRNNGYQHIHDSVVFS